MHSDAVTMRRKGDALVAADTNAAKIMERMKDGQLVAVRLIRGRSAAQNRRYWLVLKCVVDATGRWSTPDELHEALKVETGHYQAVQLIGGRVIKVPGSTSFDEMGQDAFQAYMDAAFRILCDEVLGGMSVEELLQEAEAA